MIGPLSCFEPRRSSDEANEVCCGRFSSFERPDSPLTSLRDGEELWPAIGVSVVLGQKMAPNSPSIFHV